MRNYPNIRNNYIEKNNLKPLLKQSLGEVSNTHWLSEIGYYHGKQHEKYVYESDGIGTKIISPHITNQTVISKKGTATLTISTGEIQIGAGWVTEIELSDGTLYRCEEQQGTIAYDASGNGNHGSLINNIIHTPKRDETLINYTNELGYSNDMGTIIPRAVNSNLDALGNTCEFIGKVASDMKLINSNCVLSNGISVTGTFNFSCSGLSITSKEGTATVTFDTTTNKITIGAGTLYNLVLSNGYHFPIAEGLGSRSYRALDHEKYITWTNITWTTQDEYHYNINNGFTDDDAKLPLKGLIKVEDEPWTWITQGHYANWKNNWFLPSTNGTLLKGDAIDYAAVTEIGQLGSKNLTTDFNVNFLGKFKNLEELYIDNNQISILDISLNEKLSIVYFNDNQISNFNTSSNPLLTYVIGYNNNLETVDFTNNPLLTNIQLYNNNKLTAINTLSNPLLKELIVLMNSITSFDFSNNTLLENVRLQGNNFHSLDISMLSNLKYLYMSVANITTLDTSNNPELLELSIPFCNINSLSFLNNTKLVYFRGNNNKLTNLVNSQILIDLDAHGKSNGFFSSSIYGGGTLTAAGLIAKANLQAKGWNIVGV